MFQLCDSPLTPATSVGDGVSSPSSSYTQEDDAREFAFDSLPPSGISSDGMYFTVCRCTPFTRHLVVSYGENLAKDFPLSFSDTKYGAYLTACRCTPFTCHPCHSSCLPRERLGSCDAPHCRRGCGVYDPFLASTDMPLTLP